MKKNIGYYNLSPALMKWLRERICGKKAEAVSVPEEAQEKQKEEKQAEEKRCTMLFGENTEVKETESEKEAKKEKEKEELERGELCRGIEGLLKGEYDVISLAREGAVHMEQAYFLDNSENQKLSCGQLEIDPRARRVLRAGTELSLTPKEFDILYFLVQNRGIVFSKEQIYEAVWRGDYLMDDSNIMAFIRKLRKKIEPNPDAPEYILTVWGVGYKFREDLE